MAWSSPPNLYRNRIRVMNTECFVAKLFNEIADNLRNDYSDNYDENRYGDVPKAKKSLKEKIFSIIRKKWRIIEDCHILQFNSLTPYYNRMAQVYDILDNEDSKNLYVKLIAYRILGYHRVKLPLNTAEFKKRNKISDEFKIGKEYIETPFVSGQTIKLYKHDLSKKDIPLKIYASSVYYLLFVNQYENDVVKIDEGDVLLDCGACWGDTALYFANKVGNAGHVYSFEFIPENIDVFKKNIALNENISSRLTIVQNALGAESGKILSFSNNGPGSKVGINEENSIKVESLTIDDFVAKNSIDKINFIKMDIEGSELPSLKGAVNVLKKYKPKLAISIYHSLDDFVDIPLFLNSLNLGYKFYIKHGTIHHEETVLLAISR